jgi:diacylglycerol kinase family enzyme
MAGGDGSQAVVAGIAAAAGLPYACAPAGTRNHFALDLGVDRRDVVGALDALVDGAEYRVDLGDVNGRVFVNNVSLGIYGEAVQRRGYRNAKLKTLLDTVPSVLGPEGKPLNLHWRGPDGCEHASAALILVSNNRYRLRPGVGAGTRPRLDSGLLGIVIVDPPPPPPSGPAKASWYEWSAQSFEVKAAEPVPAGVDGEAVVLEPPLKFSIRRAVLRVRVSRRHPGGSPSAAVPEGVCQGIQSLMRIALGSRRA